MLSLHTMCGIQGGFFIIHLRNEQHTDFGGVAAVPRIEMKTHEETLRKGEPGHDASS